MRQIIMVLLLVAVVGCDPNYGGQRTFDRPVNMYIYLTDGTVDTLHNCVGWSRYWEELHIKQSGHNNDGVVYRKDTFLKWQWEEICDTKSSR